MINVHWQLTTDLCSLLTDNCSLLTDNCSLFTDLYSLTTDLCSLTTKIMEIYTSRKKNIFLLFLSLLFLAAGIYFVLHGEEIAAGKRSPLLVQGIGIAAIAFALLALFFTIKNLLNKRWVLRANPEGLYLRIRNELFIPWQEITGFQVFEVRGSKSVLIMLKDPQAYIAKEKSPFLRKMMQWNLRLCGTSVSISSSTMQISHKELLALLIEYWNKYKK